MRALFWFVAGIVAILVALLLVIVGSGITFGAGVGVIYYGLVLILGAGGALTIAVAWSYLP